MTRTKDAWAAVGDQIEALALKVKLHAEEERAEDGEAVATAFDRLGAAVTDVVNALQDAVRDPAVRDDARAAVRATGEALAVTAAALRDSATRRDD